MKKQIGRNGSQYLQQNCKKFTEWNGIYANKSQTKTLRTLKQENEVKVS